MGRFDSHFINRQDNNSCEFNAGELRWTSQARQEALERPLRSLKQNPEAQQPKCDLATNKIGKKSMAKQLSKYKYTILFNCDRIIMDIPNSQIPLPIQIIRKIATSSHLYQNGPIAVQINLLIRGEAGLRSFFDLFNEMGGTYLCIFIQLIFQQKLIFTLTYIFIHNTNSQMDSKAEDSIQVCIRIRPGQEQQSIVQFTSNQIHLEKNHFGFDKIFPPQSTQEEIFQEVGIKLITRTLDGYNGCIFVYGQTGSGKTYTMMGDGNGLMQKSFIQLFSQIQQLQKSECSINCSYYQIYNEQIIDLLDTRKDKKLNIRQDLRKGVFVENLTEESAYSSLKLLDCLNTGMRNRHVGETMMNRESSRSHSIFTISFSIKSQINGSQVLKTPKLHFVDLAGSERQKMTAASGERLKQAGNINKSLTTLGMVINALASQKSRTHIPYRDSKLTCLLRDSLGGNSKTYLIATISRKVECFQQTLSTLNFANRAKMVKVKALVNEESLSTNLQTYKQEIRRLKAEIARLKSEKLTPTPTEVRWLSKPVEQSQNYDNQFKQINNKISVISQHLIKNPSPSLEQLLEQIKKLKPQRSLPENSERNEMVDENNMNSCQECLSNMQNDEEQDPLIQYLSCNNNLLEKIHSKIDQYVQLKSNLRNMAYNNQLTIAALKTPSKFERQQLEGIIESRNQQIVNLHNQLRQLRGLIAQQELKIQEHATYARNQANVNEQSNVKYEREIIQMQRELSTLRNLVKQANQQLEIMNMKYIQSQSQHKEVRELYLYAEQNYETQKALRDQIQSNLMLKLNQIEQLRIDYTQKLEENKEYFEQIEEGLRQQLSVLSQTIQFNQNLIADYKLKLHEEKDKSQAYLQTISQLESEVQSKKIQVRQLSAKLAQGSQKIQELSEQIRRNDEMYRNQLSQKMEYIGNLQSQVNALTAQNNEQRAKFEQENQINTQKIAHLTRVVQEIQQLNTQLKQQHSEHIQSLTDYHNTQLNHLQQTHQQTCQKYQHEISTQQTVLNQTQTQLETTAKTLAQNQHQLKTAQQQYEKYQQEAQIRIRSIYEEARSKLEQAKVLEIENQELKKQYKILQKENYKIKAKHSENYSKTQEQLATKVDYYEEKFKLMSIQYQKAMEVVKKLKEKEMNQAQKIMTLQQSHKAIKINGSTHQQSSIMRNLTVQNHQLKKQVQTLKSRTLRQQSSQSYLNKVTIEQQKTILKQKQQYFKTKIQQSINRWDPSKQNTIKDRTLEELITCWEELDAESCKKFDAIAKGIKRQQKLKTQNNLILKENLYLKEQLSHYQKQHEGNPRKRVKLELMQIAEDSME